MKTPSPKQSLLLGGILVTVSLLAGLFLKRKSPPTEKAFQPLEIILLSGCKCFHIESGKNPRFELVKDQIYKREISEKSAEATIAYIQNLIQGQTQGYVFTNIPQRTRLTVWIHKKATGNILFGNVEKL